MCGSVVAAAGAARAARRTVAAAARVDAADVRGVHARAPRRGGPPRRCVRTQCCAQPRRQHQQHRHQHCRQQQQQPQQHRALADAPAPRTRPRPQSAPRRPPVSQCCCCCFPSGSDPTAVLLRTPGCCASMSSKNLGTLPTILSPPPSLAKREMRPLPPPLPPLPLPLPLPLPPWRLMFLLSEPTQSVLRVFLS